MPSLIANLQQTVPSLRNQLDAVQQASSLSGMLLAAGPLADRLFEPLLAPGGLLAGSMGPVVGVGPGRGIGLMFLIMGVIKVAVSLGGYRYAPIRRVEDELPDAPADRLCGVA